MELKDYVSVEFDGLDRNLKRVLNGLTQPELEWRPACGCNSIGLILFHVVRGEDSFVQARLQNKTEIWTTGKWHKRLNVPENEAGAHYTVEQVNCFPVPKLEDILAYYEAVRAATKEYVKQLTPASFDNKITMPHFGEITVAAMISLIVGHASGHIGEISYLRGLQRGMDK
jgi:hypothetical protein